MSKMIELNLRPDAGTLRSFGFIAVAGFGFLAAIAWFQVLVFSAGLGAARVPVAATFAAIAVISGLFSLVAPKANLPIYLAISIATYPIGFVLSYVIMGTLFYLIIAPVGFVLRILGADPMDRGFRPEAETYWVDAAPQRARSTYFKQF